MGEKIQNNILNKVESAIELVKKRNLRNFENAFLSYEETEPLYDDAQIQGIDNKILRLPGNFFMSVEYCWHDAEKENEYELAYYVPSPLPDYKKCQLVRGNSEDDAFHRHDYYELTYVYKGQRVMEVEDQEILLNENDVCVFDMKCAHLDIRKRSEGIAFYCGFTGKLMDSWFINHIKSKAIKNFFLMNKELKSDAGILLLHMDEKAQPVLQKGLSDIFYELENEELGYEKIAQIEMLRIMNALQDEARTTFVGFEERLKGQKIYHAVARYINSNLATASLDALAEQFHFQKDYFNRLIKKNTGLTFSEYVKSLRLDKARNLLVNTQMRVSDIMMYLGYEQHAYFYKIFKEATGMTPTEYRDVFK